VADGYQTAIQKDSGVATGHGGRPTTSFTMAGDVAQKTPAAYPERHENAAFLTPKDSRGKKNQTSHQGRTKPNTGKGLQ
jgi:hypothetical protein